MKFILHMFAEKKTTENANSHIKCTKFIAIITLYYSSITQNSVYRGALYIYKIIIILKKKYEYYDLYAF